MLGLDLDEVTEDLLKHPAENGLDPSIYIPGDKSVRGTELALSCP
jgi:hypothetical protein